MEGPFLKERGKLFSSKNAIKVRGAQKKALFVFQTFSCGLMRTCFKFLH